MPQHVTVKEAKNIWCRHGLEPTFKDVNFSDGAGIAGIAVNRGSAGGPSTMCFANGCMAWTWVSRVDADNVDPEKDKGFCGAETW